MIPPRAGAILRLTWTIGTILVVQTLVCGLAALPVALMWARLLAWTSGAPALRLVVCSLAAVPSYAAFAVTLMFVSAVTTRVLGWHTQGAAEMPIAAMGWPLLGWVRYMAAIHVVRFLAGSLARGTPVWTAYLRLCGARLGRRVYVNSLGLSDYNLLEFGDDVVIGADVHIAGHTVERGLVRTGMVRLGRGVTIGVGTLVDIDVVVGDGCQVGALSFVPKHERLESGLTYVGIPVRPVETPARVTAAEDGV